MGIAQFAAIYNAWLMVFLDREETILYNNRVNAVSGKRAFQPGYPFAFMPHSGKCSFIEQLANSLGVTRHHTLLCGDTSFAMFR